MAWRLPFLSRLRGNGDLPLIRRLMVENAWDFRGRYLIAFGAMAMFAIATAGTAWLMRDVIDGIFLQGGGTALYLLPLAMGGLYALRGFSGFVSYSIIGRIGNAVVGRLRRRLYDKILKLDATSFDGLHSAELVTRISHHTLAARESLEKIANVMVRDVLSLSALLVVMIVQSPVMSLIVFTAGPIVIFAVSKLVQKTRQAAREEFGLIERIGALVQETALGIRVVRAFNLERTMRAKARQAVDEVEAHANRVTLMRARTAPIADGVAGLAVAGIMLWAGYSVLNLGASPGPFIAFVTAMLLAYEPAARLSRFNVQLAATMEGIRRIYELLDTPTVQPKGGDRKFKVSRGEIRFDNVVFRYRPNEPLFDGLTFTAEPGKTTALVGPSGVGKSTVIALIERFYDPQAGRILIDGRDIAEVDLGTLRRQIAMVSQDIRLFGGSIRDNIRMGRLDATDADIERAARDAMAHDFIAAMPNGYDSVLGEGSASLSGGQRQRLAIARALLRDAPIVLLDEATSALDSESETHVQAAFERLKQNRTTIVIAHRLSTVRTADKICVFQDGDVVESGTHAELIAENRHYAKLHRLQFTPEPSLVTPDGD